MRLNFRDNKLAPIWDRVQQGERLGPDEGLVLFKTPDVVSLGRMAGWVAEQRHGRKAYYVLNRQCNPTNICVLNCRFCNYARKKGQEGAWEMTLEEILAHCEGGIREIHIVGGLHPDWKFDAYLNIVAEIRRRHPRLGIKAWTAVEVEWFSRIAKIPIRQVLEELKAAGLDCLPGGGAEVFSERVRRELFYPKIGWDLWSEVHRTAHELGIQSNATLLYGHIETYEERVDHLLKLRGLEDEAPGFLAFIPLSFQPGTTGIPGQATAMEDARTVAASRLLLDNVAHVKAYWVMLGAEMASIALGFGASDMDGTIGRETIAHMAGAASPEGMAVESMQKLIREAGKEPVERDIFYRVVEGANA
jgi:aminodeoxyfutalosine synthase